MKKSVYLFFFLSSFLPTSSIFSEERSNAFCHPPWEMDRITSCAIENHPSFQLEAGRLLEMQGRKRIANYYFPSNPNVSTYLSNRNSAGPGNLFSTTPMQATNFQLMVTQEVYIGEKREKLIQIADEEFRAQWFKLESVRRNIYFLAISSLIRYLNAIKEEEFCFKLYQLSQNLTKISKARVKERIAPGLDESLAESEELRMAKIWKAALRKREQFKGEVYLLLSLPLGVEMAWNPSIQIEANLSKNKDELIALAIENRPEIQLTEKEIKLALLRYEEVRLQKTPNLSFGAFVQNDGFNERVVGGQLSMPLVVWRDFEGESAVAKAKGEQAIQSRGIIERSIKQEVINSLSTFLAFQEEIDLYDQTFLLKTDSDLQNISDALLFGKIKVIDAINNQRVLVQTRLNFIQTKNDYELSQIEVIRALGLPTTQLIVKELK